MLPIPKYSYFGASFATVVRERFGLPLVSSLGTIWLCSWVKKGERAAYFFGLSLALFQHYLFENAPLTLITVIDFVMCGVVIYELGIKDDDKRLILGLLKSARLTRAER